MEKRGTLEYFTRTDPSLILPEEHPITGIIEPFFRRAEWFNSLKSMEERGFLWSTPPSQIRYWCRQSFHHPDLPGYEFHGVPRDSDPKNWRFYSTQLEKQVVKTRNELAQLVDEKGWDRLVAPETWLYFPIWGRGKHSFRVSRTLPLLSVHKNVAAYWEIEEEVLRQILEMTATVKLPFDGPPSLPFLESGKVALFLRGEQQRRIDGFPNHFLPYLSPERARRARALWSEILLRKEEEWPPDTISRTLRQQMEPYLLSSATSEAKALEKICTAPEIFADRGALADAGFELLGGSARHYSFQIMTARHADFPDYVIKSFPLIGDYRDHYARLREYVTRCQGADRIRTFVRERGFQYVDAPAKGIFPLPSRFTSPRAPDGKFLLISEEVELMEKRAAKRWQEEIPIPALEELVQIFHQFGSSDSSWENHPITSDEKIVWIDTEHIGYSRQDHLFEGFRRMVSPDRWEYAKAYWETL